MSTRPLFQGLDIKFDAVFSPCRTWRYVLYRTWGVEAPLVWIGLNPSTADEQANDPTCERCMRRSIKLGYGGYVMLNLFGYRSTDPKPLRAVKCPVGPDNDLHIVRECSNRDVVLAWGVNEFGDRGEQVIDIARRNARRLLCLGKTKSGYPRHPLYVGYQQPLVGF